MTLSHYVMSMGIFTLRMDVFILIRAPKSMRNLLQPRIGFTTHLERTLNTPARTFGGVRFR